MIAVETQECSSLGTGYSGFDSKASHVDDVAKLSESAETEYAGPDDCPRLGALRAEWESPSKLTAAIMATSFVCGLLSLYFLPMVVWLGVMVVASLVAFAANSLGSKDRTRHFQDGLRVERGNEVTEIEFSDLGTYSAEWTDTYTNGVYNGTSVRMKVFSKSDIAKTIEFEHSANKGKLKYEQLESLQALMSAQCAARMRSHLDANGSVPWTSTLTIVDDGLICRKSSIDEGERVNFSEMSKFEMNNGKLKIWTDGWGAKVAQSANEPNFFPGLLLLQLLGKYNAAN